MSNFIQCNDYKMLIFAVCIYVFIKIGVSCRQNYGHYTRELTEQLFVIAKLHARTFIERLLSIADWSHLMMEVSLAFQYV